VVADLGDRQILLSVMPRVGAGIHFVGESVRNPRKYFGTNVELSLTLLNAALDSGIRKFVFSSSCAVYGIPASCRSRRTPHGNRSTHMACLSFLLKMPWNLMIARMLCDLPALRYFNAAGADESGEIGEIYGPEMHMNPLA
jgi:UDP-glucose 4-epimerase